MATETRTLNEGLSIGDVAKICGVEPHTIRFWEREFREYLQPGRTTGRQRRYTDDDIERLMRIRRILWVDGFTIQGARRILSGASFVSLLSAVGVEEPLAQQVA